MARKVVVKNIWYDDVRKTHYVSFEYGKDENGKRVKTTKTYKSLREAKKALSDFEADKIKNNIVIPTKLTLKDWLEYWLNDIKGIRCGETTLYGYKNIINKHINPTIGNVQLQAVTPSVINSYIRQMKTKGLTDNTIRKHYALLKDALKHAVNEDKILKNPLDKVEPLKEVKNERDYYNLEQLKKLLEVVDGDRMEIVVKLAGMLGMRREELAALKWKNIDLENKTIAIVEARTQAGKHIIEKDTKNASSYRTLHMPNDIAELLTKIKAAQEENKRLLGSGYTDGGYVICWEDGTPYKPNYLSDILTKIVRENNLDYITLHGLRHTFSSISNDLGVSMFEISKTLGHSTVATTSKIYTHMFDPIHKSAIDTVSGALFKEDE
ncbi:tyrosine-type recombinase/integrase [Tyzzerella sp. OttesenSCG-928-J15]|nr:tyrosine-type recombinase/integrase [Tyzzerella sp. OttesenSCG-928-J15]